MSDLFSSGAFGLLPMLLSGGNKGGSASQTPQQPMTAVSRQPPTVNPNMGASQNYWNGNNFVIPGFSNPQGPGPNIPAGTLPRPGHGALAGLTPGQLQNIMAMVLKPGQNAQPPAAPPQMAGQQPMTPPGIAPGGFQGFGGGVGNFAGGNGGIQALIEQLRRQNPGMGPNVGGPQPLLQRYA